MVTKAENTGQALRRSTRVSIDITIHVRSLDPAFHFEEDCRTLLVNAQGCGFQCSRQVPVGIAVVFTIEGRQATATILNATFLGESSGAWVIGAKLHQNGNFWGLANPPADWLDSSSPHADVPAQHAAIDQYIADRVTYEIRRQTEQAMSGLRAELEKMVTAREAEFLARIAQDSSASSREIARHIAEQESGRVRETFEELSRQFRQDFAEHSQRRAAEVEAGLKQAQLRFLADAEARFEATAREIEHTMQQNAARLSESTMAQWHAAFEQTLQMLPELVRENLQRGAGPDPPLTQH